MDNDNLDSTVYSKPVVPHLKSLFTKTEHLFHKRDTFLNKKPNNVQHYPSSLRKLGLICQRHCVFDVAMKYFSLALEFVQCSEDYSDVDVAHCHSYEKTRP